MSDQKRPYRMTAPRRARGGDAPADHRERGRAARGARPRPDLDQRRSPSAPACAARRSTATSRTRTRCSRPAPRTGARRTRRPTRAPGPRSTTRPSAPRPRSRELYAFYGRTEAMYTSLLRDEPLVPAVQRRLRDFHGYLRRDPGHPHGRPRPARPRGAPDARGDRPRARLPDLALADPRAGTGRREAIDSVHAGRRREA